MSKRVYKKAIKVFGRDPQIVAAIEEMGELTQALARYLNGKSDNVEEELADVSIMLEQLQLLFDKRKIKKIKKQKLERLETMLDNYKE